MCVSACVSVCLSICWSTKLITRNKWLAKIGAGNLQWIKITTASKHLVAELDIIQPKHSLPELSEPVGFQLNDIGIKPACL